MTDHDACQVIHVAPGLATLVNQAMQIEREQVLQAESHRRTADRQGCADGFKPKACKAGVVPAALVFRLRKAARVV